MRLPLSPSKSPGKDTVSAGSAFSVVAMLRAGGGGTPNVHQKVANEVAVEDRFEEPSLLCESLTSAFAERCDHLIADIEAVRVAPALFNPMWPITVLAAGTRNEEWMMFWSTMRRPVKA